jgi:hypothetical protein
MISLIFVTINLVVDIFTPWSIRACARPSAARPKAKIHHVRRRRPTSGWIERAAPGLRRGWFGRALDSDIFIVPLFN